MPEGVSPVLTIQGGKGRFCDGASRQEFLKIGGLTLGGWLMCSLGALAAHEPQ